MEEKLLDINNFEYFILNYEIEDSKIIVDYACGRDRDKCTIPYRIINEKKILEKVKYQVLNSYNYEKKEKKNSTYYSTILGIGVLGTLASTICIATNILPFSFYDVLFSSVYGFCFSIPMAIYGTYKNIDIKRKLNCIEKNKSLLENEDLLKVNSNNLSDEKSYNYSNGIIDIKYKLVKQVSEDTLYSRDKEKVNTLIKK